jgi:hypothetical protein
MVFGGLRGGPDAIFDGTDVYWPCHQGELRAWASATRLAGRPSHVAQALTEYVELVYGSAMRWLRRRGESAPSTGQDEPEAPLEVGGDRIVFWKAKSEMVDDEIYGPVWIADANDPDVTLEEFDEWLTFEQAQEVARKRDLPLDEV